MGLIVCNNEIVFDMALFWCDTCRECALGVYYVIPSPGKTQRPEVLLERRLIGVLS